MHVSGEVITADRGKRTEVFKLQRDNIRFKLFQSAACDAVCTSSLRSVSRFCRGSSKSALLFDLQESKRKSQHKYKK